MYLIQLDAHSGINLDRILEWSDDPSTGTLCLLWDDQTRIGYRGERRQVLLATLQAHSTAAPEVTPPSREARLTAILGRYLTQASGKAQLTQNLLSAVMHVLFWEIKRHAESVSPEQGRYCWLVGEPTMTPYHVEYDGHCSCKMPGIWQCSHALAVKFWQELEE